MKISQSKVDFLSSIIKVWDENYTENRISKSSLIEFLQYTSENKSPTTSHAIFRLKLIDSNFGKTFRKT